MKGLNAIPKKVAKVKTELIDLDLVRGSAFTKAKSQQGWLTASFTGIIRVILLPFYLRWWSEQTNSLVCGLFLCLYLLQAMAIQLYFENVFNSKDFAEVPVSEVLMPVFMMLILGAVQSQIVGPNSSKKSRNISHNSPRFGLNSSHEKTIKKYPKAKSPKSVRSRSSQNRVQKISDEESGLGSIENTNENTRKPSLSERRGFVTNRLDLADLKEKLPRIEIKQPYTDDNSDLSSDCESCGTKRPKCWRRYSDLNYRSNATKSKDRVCLTDPNNKLYSDEDVAKKSKVSRKKRRKPINKSMHLTPPTSRRENHYCSSCDSEGTMSPPTPNTPTPLVITWCNT